MRTRAAAPAVLLAAIAAASASAAGGRGPYHNGLVAFDRCCGPTGTGIYVVEPDGSGEKRIYAPKADDAALTPAWSPDGLWLLTAGIDRGDLMLVRPDGSATQALTHASDYFNSWPSWQALPGH